MLEECPHCYTRVVPTEDGDCPACRRSFGAESATPGSTAVWIRKGAELPPLCIRCGQRATRRTRVTRERRVQRPLLDLATKPVDLLPAWLRIPAKVAYAAGFQTERLSIEVPLCDAAHEEPATRILAADFERGRLRVVAARELAAELPDDARPLT